MISTGPTSRHVCQTSKSRISTDKTNRTHPLLSKTAAPAHVACIALHLGKSYCSGGGAVTVSAVAYDDMSQIWLTNNQTYWVLQCTAPSCETAKNIKRARGLTSSQCSRLSSLTAHCMFTQQEILKMPGFADLRKKIPRGLVLLPGDEGYEESLERWSLTCVKRAVSLLPLM